MIKVNGKEVSKVTVNGITEVDKVVCNGSIIFENFVENGMLKSFRIDSTAQTFTVINGGES